MSQTQDPETLSLPTEVFLNIADENLNFEDARNAATQLARKHDSDPRLIGWIDRRSGKKSPEQSEDEPSGADSEKFREGCMTVNVNHGDYLFIFQCKHTFTPPGHA